MDPPKDAQYRIIVSFMAPPYMNMRSRRLRPRPFSSPVTLDPENQATMEVAMLDNFGARYVPGRLYQKKRPSHRTQSATHCQSPFQTSIDDSDRLASKLGVDSDG